MPTVEITVRLAPGASAPGAAITLRAQVEEVGPADAPARVVAREVVRGVLLNEPRQLSLEVAEPNPTRRYTVRVHADVDGSGLVAVHDLVSTRSHPVLTLGGPNTITVELSPASP
ncbi:YbaY family lipoprotein [Streptomyces sp. NBC_00690]|uniref:YbaY family lipoprotein n=1 Tax=Streptomyces sp. NBC_00690 TaxID=2975808 RepID=UPI002E2966D7|nr:YbaY family lipoprotein [Streptomyces sp. NBC_00690]